MKAFRYVREDYVESYFKMGWMMSERPLMYEGEYRVWLMVWICDCIIPNLKSRKK